MDRLDRADRFIARVEQLFLVFFLGVMLAMALSQILLRNVFATGISWGDPLVRYLVVWVGFIGASIAAHEDRHLNIDAVSRWLPPLGERLVQALTHTFSFVVCGFLTFAAIKFVDNEAQIGDVTFFGIPTWVPQLVIPVTLGLMTLRFGLRAVRPLKEIPADRKAPSTKTVR